MNNTKKLNDLKRDKEIIKELHPRQVFNYNKLTFKQIERLEEQYLKYENKKNYEQMYFM
mgnify:CR=1 FL=1